MLSLTLEGFEETILALTKLEGALDSEDIQDEAEALLLNRIRTRFLAEEGPEGPWIPSVAGMVRKAGGYTTRNGKRYTSTGTLFETGTLFHSIQAAREDDNTRVIFTDVPYAKFVHDGTKYLPTRVFLGFNDEDLSLMVRRVLQRIEEVL